MARPGSPYSQGSAGSGGSDAVLLEDGVTQVWQPPGPHNYDHWAWVFRADADELCTQLRGAKLGRLAAVAGLQVAHVALMAGACVVMGSTNEQRFRVTTGPAYAYMLVLVLPVVMLCVAVRSVRAARRAVAAFTAVTDAAGGGGSSARGVGAACNAARHSSASGRPSAYQPPDDDVQYLLICAADRYFRTQRQHAAFHTAERVCRIADSMCTAYHLAFVATTAVMLARLPHVKRHALVSPESYVMLLSLCNTLSSFAEGVFTSFLSPFTRCLSPPVVGVSRDVGRQDHTATVFFRVVVNATLVDTVASAGIVASPEVSHPLKTLVAVLAVVALAIAARINDQTRHSGRLHGDVHEVGVVVYCYLALSALLYDVPMICIRLYLLIKLPGPLAVAQVPFIAKGLVHFAAKLSHLWGTQRLVDLAALAKEAQAGCDGCEANDHGAGGVGYGQGAPAPVGARRPLAANTGVAAGTESARPVPGARDQAHNGGEQRDPHARNGGAATLSSGNGRHQHHRQMLHHTVSGREIAAEALSHVGSALHHFGEHVALAGQDLVHGRTPTLHHGEGSQHSHQASGGTSAEPMLGGPDAKLDAIWRGVGPQVCATPRPGASSDAVAPGNVDTPRGEVWDGWRPLFMRDLRQVESTLASPKQLVYAGLLQAVQLVHLVVMVLLYVRLVTVEEMRDTVTPPSLEAGHSHGSGGPFGAGFAGHGSLFALLLLPVAYCAVVFLMWCTRLQRHVRGWLDGVTRRRGDTTTGDKLRELTLQYVPAACAARYLGVVAEALRRRDIIDCCCTAYGVLLGVATLLVGLRLPRIAADQSADDADDIDDFMLGDALLTDVKRQVGVRCITGLAAVVLILSASLVLRSKLTLPFEKCGACLASNSLVGHRSYHAWGDLQEQAKALVLDASSAFGILLVAHLSSGLYVSTALMVFVALLLAWVGWVDTGVGDHGESARDRYLLVCLALLVIRVTVLLTRPGTIGVALLIAEVSYVVEYDWSSLADDWTTWCRLHWRRATGGRSDGVAAHPVSTALSGESAAVAVYGAMAAAEPRHHSE